MIIPILLALAAASLPAKTFYEACKEGDVSLLGNYLSDPGLNVNVTSVGEPHCLFFVANIKNQSLVKLLLDHPLYDNSNIIVPIDADGESLRNMFRADPNLRLDPCLLPIVFERNFLDPVIGLAVTKQALRAKVEVWSFFQETLNTGSLSQRVQALFLSTQMYQSANCTLVAKYLPMIKWLAGETIEADDSLIEAASNPELLLTFCLTYLKCFSQRNVVLSLSKRYDRIFIWHLPGLNNLPIKDLLPLISECSRQSHRSQSPWLPLYFYTRFKIEIFLNPELPHLMIVENLVADFHEMDKDEVIANVLKGLCFYGEDETASSLVHLPAKHHADMILRYCCSGHCNNTARELVKIHREILTREIMEVGLVTVFDKPTVEHFHSLCWKNQIPSNLQYYLEGAASNRKYPEVFFYLCNRYEKVVAEHKLSIFENAVRFNNQAVVEMLLTKYEDLRTSTIYDRLWIYQILDCPLVVKFFGNLPGATLTYDDHDSAGFFRLWSLLPTLTIEPSNIRKVLKLGISMLPHDRFKAFVDSNGSIYEFETLLSTHNPPTHFTRINSMHRIQCALNIIHLLGQVRLKEIDNPGLFPYISFVLDDPNGISLFKPIYTPKTIELFEMLACLLEFRRPVIQERFIDLVESINMDALECSRFGKFILQTYTSYLSQYEYVPKQLKLEFYRQLEDFLTPYEKEDV